MPRGGTHDCLWTCKMHYVYGWKGLELILANKIKQVSRDATEIQRSLQMAIISRELDIIKR
jgi:hypothetical protein